MYIGRNVGRATIMARIKVGLCITELGIGGAERCLVELATRLDSERFEPVVYCLGPRPDNELSSCLPALEDAQIEVHCLGARGKWQFPTVLRRLRRLLQAQRPALVQTFLFHANVAGRIAACRAGVGSVVSGIRVAERRRWHLWVDRLTNRLVDRYVCVSGSVAQYSQTVARLPAEKLVVIPNGIDSRKYPASQPVDLGPLGIPPDSRVVCFVGRLERQKDVEWLIGTAANWLPLLPDCRLLIVGRGPQRAGLERLCRELGLSERVHFAGWRRDVPEILAACGLLVLPSAWEGMPNVVLEAMASGLAVLASDVEGVRELLGPGADAQTVEHGKSQAFSEKIVTIMSDGQMARRLGADNRRRAEGEFTLQRMVAQYEDLWTATLKHR